MTRYLQSLDALPPKQLNQMRAKEFPDKHVWFNSAPLSMGRDLRSKLVLIDFWTYCCINCLHVLPDLEFLE